MDVQDKQYIPFYLRVHKPIFRMLKWLISPLLFFIWKRRRGIAIFLITFAVLHTTALIITGRMLNKKLDEIKAKGEPINFSELGGKKIADNQNAYIYFKQATDKMDSDKFFKSLFKEINSKRYDDDYYILLKENENLKNSFRAWINNNLDIFTLIQHGASLPYYQVETKGKKGYEPLYLKLNIISNQRLFCIKSLIETLDGDIDKAISDSCSTLKMGNILQHHPTLDGQLWRMALDRMAIKNIRLIAKNNKLNYNQSLELYNTINKIDYSQIYKTAMIGERAIRISDFDYAKKPGVNMSFGWDTTQDIYWWLYNSHLARPFLYLDELNYLKQMTTLIESNGNIKPAQWSIPAEEDSCCEYYSLTSRFLEYYFDTKNKMLETQSIIDGTKVFLGLLAYKSKFDSYPNGLTELKTKLNWETPNDVCSGKPFTYTKKGSGFLLYGYGKNGIDDGGIRLDPNDSHKYDIVWKMDK